MSSNAVKRIIQKDMKELGKMKLESLGIHIHFQEDNVMNAKAIVIGPKDTPFENGVLYFVIEFPNNYPFSPPKVNYLSHSRYRIHPNLYVGRSRDNFLGKVCLSILNTWSGPQWTTIMHIGSVLLSIQSLLCENPLHNEPGFEKEVGARNDIYNRIVMYDTYQHLILKNCFEIPLQFMCFHDVIQEHIMKEKENIMDQLDKLCIQYPKKENVSINIYNIVIVFDYLRLRDIFKKKFDLK